MASATEGAGAQHPQSEAPLDSRMASRLIAAFIGLAAMGAVVGFSAILFITKIDSMLSEVTAVFTPTAETAEDMKMRFWESATVAEEMLTEEDPAGIERLATRFNNLIKVFETKHERLKGLVSDPVYAARVSHAKAAHEHFNVLVQQVIELRRATLADEAQVTRRAAAFHREADGLVADLGALAERNTQRMVESRAKGDAIAASWQLGVRDLNSVLQNVFEVEFPAVAASLRLGRLVETMRTAVAQYLAERDPAGLAAQIDAFNRAAQEARTYLDTLTRLASTEPARQEVAAIGERFAAWSGGAAAKGELLATYRRLLEARVKAREITRGFEKEAEDLVTHLRMVAVHADEVSQQADQEVDRQVDHAIIFTVLIIVIMVILATRIIVKLLPQPTR